MQKGYRIVFIFFIIFCLIAIPSKSVDAQRNKKANSPLSNITLPTLSDWKNEVVAFSHGSEGEWDFYLWGGFSNSIIKINDTYYLYYQGSPSYDDQCDSVSYRAIGLATSTDGIHWVKSDNNPVISWYSQGSIEEGAASSAAWVGEDGRVYVYYGANTGSGCTVNTGARLAVSNDGVSFQDLGEVLSGSDPNVWGTGDEIFPVGIYAYETQWHLYYIPNGVPQSRKLGIATGNSYDNFTQSSGLNNSSIPSWGPVSVILNGSESILFTNPEGANGPINIYKFDAGNPSDINFYDSYTVPGCTQSSVLYEGSVNRWLMSCRDIGANNYIIRYTGDTIYPTETSTQSPTSTPIDTATPTFTVMPSDTPTQIPSSTSTMTPSNTSTLTPTFTFTNTAIPTSTYTPTYTFTPTQTPSFTPTFTFTPSNTSTQTGSFTPTMMPSNTSTLTPTFTFTNTAPPTSTYTPTYTFTPTQTPSFSPTFTPTFTFTPSNTPTQTTSPTPMMTPSNTPTLTFTPSFTPTTSLNLAINQTVSVSSYQDSDYSGEMAVDNNITTFWKSKKATSKRILPSEWITIDLENVATINTIELEWDAYYPTDYLIRVSDDSINWITLFSTNAGDGGNDSIQSNSISGRYIQFYSTAWSSDTFRVWLREFEVFGYYNLPPEVHIPTPTSPSNPTATFTPSPTAESITSIHVGDIDGSNQSIGKNWRANVIVTVHDNNHNPVPSVSVYGAWNDGTADSCITDVVETCNMTSSRISSTTVTFLITDISYGQTSYLIVDNHDSDGDSNGSSITIQSP